MDLEKIQIYLDRFGKARDWDRLKTPKNLAMALSVEAAELVEIFQWMTPEESAHITKDPVAFQAIQEELADILAYLAQIAHILNINLEQAFWEKTKKIEKKYPLL